MQPCFVAALVGPTMTAKRPSTRKIEGTYIKKSKTATPFQVSCEVAKEEIIAVLNIHPERCCPMAMYVKSDECMNSAKKESSGFDPDWKKFQQLRADWVKADLNTRCEELMLALAHEAFKGPYNHGLHSRVWEYLHGVMAGSLLPHGFTVPNAWLRWCECRWAKYGTVRLQKLLLWFRTLECGAHPKKIVWSSFGPWKLMKLADDDDNDIISIVHDVSDFTYIFTPPEARVINDKDAKSPMPWQLIENQDSKFVLAPSRIGETSKIKFTVEALFGKEWHRSIQESINEDMAKAVQQDLNNVPHSSPPRPNGRMPNTTEEAPRYLTRDRIMQNLGSQPATPATASGIRRSNTA